MKQNSLKLFSFILVLSIPNFIWAQNAPCEEECSEGVRIEKVEIEEQVPDEVLDALLVEAESCEVSVQSTSSLPNSENAPQSGARCCWFYDYTPSERGFRSNQDDFTTSTVFTREDIQRMNRYD